MFHFSYVRVHFRTNPFQNRISELLFDMLLFERKVHLTLRIHDHFTQFSPIPDINAGNYQLFCTLALKRTIL